MTVTSVLSMSYTSQLAVGQAWDKVGRDKCRMRNSERGNQRKRLVYRDKGDERDKFVRALCGEENLSRKDVAKKAKRICPLSRPPFSAFIRG